MRILLKTVLDVAPDAAWRAVRSPTVLRELYAPMLVAEAAGEPFPDVWTNETRTMRLRAGGVLPAGEHRLEVRLDDDRADGVRILRDAGRPISGPLAALETWDHRMAVAPAPGDPARTLYRDRLVIGGAAAPALWFPLWAAWQVRLARLHALAPGWRLDLGADADTGARVD